MALQRPLRQAHRVADQAAGQAGRECRVERIRIERQARDFLKPVQPCGEIRLADPMMKGGLQDLPRNRAVITL
ncbi:MAG: hypothetical protein JO264_12645 [Acidisphaera sp.]|nr:hypothetical protein [Acidisphaera sp.]